MVNSKGTSHYFNASYYSDRDIKSKIESKLSKFYYHGDKHVSFNATTREQELKLSEDNNRRRSSSRAKNPYKRTRNFRLQSSFRHHSGFSMPTIDHDIRAEIRQSNKRSDFNSYRLPTEGGARAQDKASIREYSAICGSIPRHLVGLFASASESATKHLGLVTEDDGPLIFDTLSIDLSVDLAINDANSGYPFFVKKNNLRAINDAKQWMKLIHEKPNVYSVYKNVLMLSPKILLHRYQPKLKNKILNVKVRQVWCQPMRIIALERKYFSNILDRYADYNRAGVNVSSSNGLRNAQISNFVVSRIREKIGTRRDYSLFSLDYSSYDMTIPDFAIDLYFATMRRHLKLDKCDSKLYDLLRYYTKYGPIIYDDKIHFKSKGISSGSLLTNHFDSWWNLVLQYVAQSLASSGVKAEDIRNGHIHDFNISTAYNSSTAVCGDDCIVYASKNDIYTLQALCFYIGMKLDVLSETNNPRDPIFFLGRFWNQFSEPYQSEDYMTAHICFRSKFYNKGELPIDISKELTATRIISICCPLSNGYQYMMKTFGHYKPLIDLLKKREFVYLKDYPLQLKNKVTPISFVHNWRMF